MTSYETTRGSHHKPAFTLIELLVVMAIIAVLISILLPALSMARAEGAKAKCLAGLREIAGCTQMYMNDQDDRKLIPWYQDPPHSGYAVTIITPWVFGGFKAPSPTIMAASGAGADSSYYPARIRPLNKFVDPSATGDNDILDVYKCPADRSNSTSIIGETPGSEFEERVPSWAANGSSFTLNTRFFQGYKGGNGNWTQGDIPAFTQRIASHLIGGDASRFIMWVEQGFYSATYRAGPTLPNGAAPQRPGWHRRFSTWSLGFADGHATHSYYDTRLSTTGAGTIWQAGFNPAAN